MHETPALLQELAEAGRAHIANQDAAEGAAAAGTEQAVPDVTESDIQVLQCALASPDGSAGLWHCASGEGVSASSVARALLALMECGTKAPALRAAHFTLLLLQTAGCPVWERSTSIALVSQQS